MIERGAQHLLIERNVVRYYGKLWYLVKKSPLNAKDPLRKFRLSPKKIDEDPSYSNSDFNTVLHQICYQQLQRRSALYFAASVGADIDKKYDDCTPLQLIGHRENKKSVIYSLVVFGADINQAENNGDTVLESICNWFYSYQSNVSEMIRFLVSIGADVNRPGFDENTPLHTLCYKSSFEGIKTVISLGADIDATRYGWTALHIAVEVGDLNIVRFLIKNGASIDATNNGQTVLGIANSTRVINYLKSVQQK